MSLKSETFEKFLVFKKKLEMAQSQRHLRSAIKKDFGEFGLCGFLQYLVCIFLLDMKGLMIFLIMLKISKWKVVIWF